MAHMTEYQKDLIEALKDPTEAAAYLNAALEEGDRETFLLALRNVAEANGGMAAVADKAHLNRESLYRTLSRRGNPGNSHSVQPAAWGRTATEYHSGTGDSIGWCA